MELIQSLKAAASVDDALAAVIAHLHADSGTIHLLEDDGMLHLAAASAGIPPQVRAVIGTIPVGKGMAGLAVERRSPVDACNIQTDNSGDVRPGAKATGLQGALVVPMFAGDKVVGALGVANREARVFTPDETSLLLEAGRVLAAR
jgi:L-methionine (R)-S-oxide reductase